VRELARARTQVLVQAYSFTSAVIAKALIEAQKRGVEVKVLLDKSNVTAQYSSATFLANAAIPVAIDSQHAIAHNKIIIIDNATVITGSFNFTKAAESANAENLLLVKDAPELVQRYQQNWQLHAAHSQVFQATARPAPSPLERQASGKAQRTETPVRGNQRSHVYHLPSCPAYNALNAKNIVPFASEADAQRAGYRKAGNCP
jgi:phosphatidylserine/phosphatidylglycerophosphate/cardiolipin synthase-like enzyme